MEALLSDAQGKLSAIMTKMQGVLPFLEDNDCERAFLVLTEVAQKAFASRSTNRSAAFNEMPLEELMKLAKPAKADSNVDEEKPKKTRPRKPKRKKDDVEDANIDDPDFEGDNFGNTTRQSGIAQPRAPPRKDRAIVSPGSDGAAPVASRKDLKVPTNEVAVIWNAAEVIVKILFATVKCSF